MWKTLDISENKDISLIRTVMMKTRIKILNIEKNIVIKSIVENDGLISKVFQIKNN